MKEKVDLEIDIYYDGSDRIGEYLHKVDGVTTNIGFLKKSGIRDYSQFIKDTLSLNKDGKPISFQVFSDSRAIAREQALKIASFSPEVFVKIPIISPLGESFSSLVKEMVFENGLNINTTCVYTKSQIDELSFLNNAERPTIVSIFCGRIGDTGHDPLDIVSYAVSRFRNNDNVRILWAGCQRVCDIINAQESGCDIITVPEGVLKKVDRIGMSLADFSLKTSIGFYNDGVDLVL
tara:strand:- start:316 stop:1020 length:705 start_codon:yes stop_codon:yes gene_type:complete